MKKTGTILCLALGLGMTVTALAACGGKTPANPNPNKGGESVTLVVWLSPQDQEFGKQAAEAFKAAHPEKKYSFLFGQQSESNAGTQLLNDTQNAPDVFAFASDQLTKLVNGGALNRLGPDYVNRLKETQTEKAIDSATVTVGGEPITYAFPFTDNTYFMYYNKAKLNENDIKTLDGILAKCEGNEQFAYPMKDGWYSSAFFFGKGLGYEVEYDEAFGETKITTDVGGAEGKAVVSSMLSYVKNSHFKGDSDDSKIVAGFQDGSVIAGVSGMWNKKAIQEALGEDFGVAPLPTYTCSGQQVQLVAFEGYKLFGVCNYSENKGDALKFAEFLSSYEMQVKHFDMRGFTPTNVQAASDDAVKNDPCVKATQGVLLHSKPQKGVPTTWWSPLEGLGTAMTDNPSSFNIDSQLAAMVASIQKNAT